MGDVPPVSDAVLSRRIKNRERQRRYRARKRLEANNQNSVDFINPPPSSVQLICQPPSTTASPQIEVQLTKDVARKKRSRDWKGDAREANKVKPKEVESLDCPGDQLSPSALNTDDPVPPNRGRDWKADARSRTTDISKDFENSPGD